VSRRSEILPYSGEQSGDGDRCEGDKERRNQVIDHNTNDSTAGNSTDDVFAVVPLTYFAKIRAPLVPSAAIEPITRVDVMQTSSVWRQTR
jgi:hypothetical protein